jgi:hypothetical protein
VGRVINPATYILMVIIGASPTMRPKLKTTMEAAMTERPRAYDRYEQHPLESKGIEAARAAVSGGHHWRHSSQDDERFRAGA